MKVAVDAIRPERPPTERHVDTFQEHNPAGMAEKRTMMIAMLSPVPGENSNLRYRRWPEQRGLVRQLQPVSSTHRPDGRVDKALLDALQPVRLRFSVIIGKHQQFTGGAIQSAVQGR